MCIPDADFVSARGDKVSGSLRDLISDLYVYWRSALFAEPTDVWWTSAPEEDRHTFLAELFHRMLDEWFDDEYKYPRDASPKRNPAAALLYGLAYMDGYRPGDGTELKRRALRMTKVRSTELAAAIGVDTKTLADLLRDVGVHRGPHQMRFPPGLDGRTANTKGYHRHDLTEAWERGDGRFQAEVIRLGRERNESVRTMWENFTAAIYVVRSYPNPDSLIPA
jgi:hypothetical protein